jgi:hypothetical protein
MTFSPHRLCWPVGQAVRSDRVAERLFIAQAKLEGWIEGGKVTFQDNLLTLLAEKVAYRVEPAARITRVLDGEDRTGLVGKSVTVAELQAQKAEHFQGTVILGDTAYECEDGFMGTAEPPVVLAVPVPSVVRPPVPASSPRASAPLPPPRTPPPTLTRTPVPPPPVARLVATPSPARPPAAPPPPAAARPPAAPAAAPAAAEPKPEGTADNSADLLAEFMLKHM